MPDWRIWGTNWRIWRQPMQSPRMISRWCRATDWWVNSDSRLCKVWGRLLERCSGSSLRRSSLSRCIIILLSCSSKNVPLPLPRKCTMQTICWWIDINIYRPQMGQGMWSDAEGSWRSPNWSQAPGLFTVPIVHQFPVFKDLSANGSVTLGWRWIWQHWPSCDTFQERLTPWSTTCPTRTLEMLPTPRSEGWVSKSASSERSSSFPFSILSSSWGLESRRQKVTIQSPSFSSGLAFFLQSASTVYEHKTTITTIIIQVAFCTGHLEQERPCWQEQLPVSSTQTSSKWSPARSWTSTLESRPAWSGRCSTMQGTTSLASSSWTRLTPSAGGGSARAPAPTERSRCLLRMLNTAQESWQDHDGWVVLTCYCF